MGDDEVLTRSVAVKLLHPHLAADDSFRRALRAEAVSGASPTPIVSIYDTWSGDGTEAIVMELVAGTTLRHLIEVRRRSRSTRPSSSPTTWPPRSRRPTGPDRAMRHPAANVLLSSDGGSS